MHYVPHIGRYVCLNKKESNLGNQRLSYAYIFFFRGFLFFPLYQLTKGDDEIRYYDTTRYDTTILRDKVLHSRKRTVRCNPCTAREVIKQQNFVNSTQPVRLDAAQQQLESGYQSKSTPKRSHLFPGSTEAKTCRNATTEHHQDC